MVTALLILVYVIAAAFGLGALWAFLSIGITILRPSLRLRVARLERECDPNSSFERTAHLGSASASRTQSTPLTLIERPRLRSARPFPCPASKGFQGGASWHSR